MGIFDFLKKPKEIPETKTLSFDEVGTFLDKKSEETSKNVNEKVLSFQKEISNEKENLRKNLNILETAGLKNKEIPERVKQLMQGNREIYIQKINYLLEKIKFPENSQLVCFLEKFDKELDVFDKSISKSHQIMEELFLEKASVIRIGIKNIDKSLKEMKSSIEKSDLKKISELKNRFISIKEKISKSEIYRSQISQIAKEIQSLEKQMQEAENKLSKLKNEKSYLAIISSISEKESLEKELNESNSNLIHAFSEISPALKKYENLSQNKLAGKYLENPLNALLEDSQFEILAILDAIQKAIIKNEITLKDKKKDRIMNELFILNKDFLAKFLSERTELAKSISEKTAEIKSSQILKSIFELENSLKESKAQLEEKTLELEKMKKDIDSNDFESQIHSLENGLKEKLNLEIKII